MKYIIALALLFTSLQAAVFGQAASPAPAQAATCDLQSLESIKDERLQTFQVVWCLIKKNYFDVNLGGVDWDKIREQYATRVVNAKTGKDFNALLEEMLGQLNHSHLGIHSFASEGTLSPLEQLTHGIGVNLRIISGQMIITNVEPTSTGAQAGLRPGFIITKVDGKSIEQIISELAEHYPKNSSGRALLRAFLPAEILDGYIKGGENTSVQIVYLDEKNVSHEVAIKRETLKGEMSPPYGPLSWTYTEFESKKLEGGIGYIRFNSFNPMVMERLCASIRAMADAPGLIIDLRGNMGGIPAAAQGIAGLLSSKKFSLGTLEYRVGKRDLDITPQKSPYNGNVVILIDGGSASASELFASGLQEAGRALVVGMHSAGALLLSVKIPLPNGTMLEIPIADFKTPKGRAIERVGVNPDINVELTREALLKGQDPQLIAAIEYIRRSPHPIAATLPPTPSTKAAARIQTKPPAALTPDVKQILEKYIQAIGGTSALNGLSSRIAEGTYQERMNGADGTFQIYEKAPNKLMLSIQVEGLGAIGQGFNGTVGWFLHPLLGFDEDGSDKSIDTREELSVLSKNAIFKEYYSSIKLLSKQEDISNRKAYVLEATDYTGESEKLYFDIETGLLLRKGDTSFNDYRKIDGVMLPFFIDAPDGTYAIEQIKPNVQIDDAIFNPPSNCFTRP